MVHIPLSGTNIRLLNNIPFSNDYKHTRWFTSKVSQTNYFTSKPSVHTMSQANFQRIDGRHYVRVNQSIDDLWNVNYLMFQNASYNNKWFYAFVTKLEYKNSNLTHVHFELDVLQTWLFDINFKPSFVVREHTKLWNDDGTPVINTVDEGLDYGSDYDTIKVDHVRVLQGLRWFVIVSKTKLNGDNEVNATITGVPQPLSIYFIPFKIDGSTPKVFVHGIQYDRLTTPIELLNNLYQHQWAVNNIVSMYITEYTGIPATYNRSLNLVMISNDYNLALANIGAGVVLRTSNITSFSSQTIYSREKYADFKTVSESKLLMYPYTVTTIDDFKGNRLDIKNEYINHDRIRIRVKGSLGTSNYVSYAVQDYNRSDSVTSDEHEAIENEHAIVDNSPDDITVLNDHLAAFLQGNKNSLNNQKAQIGFNTAMGSLGQFVAGASAGASKNPYGVATATLGLVQGLGQSVLELQGMMAKQKDISNIPPNISSMGSNTSYNNGNGYIGIRVIKKQIKDEYIKKLTDFFKMFGYKVNEVKIPNFRTRQHFNYVETRNCNIQGNINNNDLQAIKNIFDSGITLWHTDDIGNYNLENGVR